MAATRPPEPPGRGGDRPAWERRVVCAEVNGRRVNEAIQRGQEPDAHEAMFICECGRVGCAQKLRLTLAEYDSVRSSFERFLIAPGHEIESIDTVAEDHDEYAVAVKSAPGSDLAQETDMRA